jgi:hypothetical protein
MNNIMWLGESLQKLHQLDDQFFVPLRECTLTADNSWNLIHGNKDRRRRGKPDTQKNQRKNRNSKCVENT